MSNLSPLSVNHSSLIFQRPEKGVVKVTRVVLELWSPHVQNSAEKPEAGGVLMGRRMLNTNDIIIDMVTTPMPGDRQKRFRFFRSKQAHQARINQIWQESKGAVNYIGEWHTHPEALPTPSCMDKLDWKRLVRSAQYDGEELFFFIVGIDDIRGWEVCRTRTKVSQLRILT